MFTFLDHLMCFSRWAIWREVIKKITSGRSFQDGIPGMCTLLLCFLSLFYLRLALLDELSGDASATVSLVPKRPIWFRVLINVN